MRCRIEVAVLLLVSSIARATSLAPEPVVDPHEYVSPSGEWRLFVDPSDRHGRGGGLHRLSRGAQTIWEKSLPYTFYGASVTDTGKVAGYAYTYGLYGFSRRRDDDTFGELVLAIFNSDGKAVLEEHIQREFDGFAIGKPICGGVMIDQGNGIATFRVSEQWRAFSLTNGKESKAIDFMSKLPEQDVEAFRHVITADVLPGTSLTLIQWWRYDKNPRASVGSNGVSFTLHKPEGTPVWIESWPGELEFIEGDPIRQALLWQIRDQGSIIGYPGPARFELVEHGQLKRITYEIVTEDGAVKVREIARADYVQPSEQIATTQPVDLKKIGEIRLTTSAASNPVRDTRGQFDIDDRGRIGALRRDAKSVTFVLVGSDGSVLAEHKLAPEFPVGESWQQIAWLRDSRWVVCSAASGTETRSKGWWLDADTGKIRPIPTFDAPFVDKLTRTPDGGFVAYGDMHYRATVCRELIAHDADGKVRWKMDTNIAGPTPADCARSAAVLTDGRIAILTPSSIELCNGPKPVHSIALDGAFGRAPHYPSDINPDVDGGVIVEDSGGEPSVFRIRNDGSVRGKFTPRIADGTIVRPLRGIRVDPTGSVWCTDGHSFFRLKDDGVADAIIGAKPGDGTLQSVSAIAIDFKGNIAAVSSRGGIVQTWSPEGIPQKQARLPDVGDDTYRRYEVNYAPDGSPHVRLGLQRWRVTDKDRLEPFPALPKMGDLDMPEMALSLPRGGTWLGAYEKAWIFDATGKMTAELQRRPDHRWLRNPDDAVIAPDGSIAIFDRASEDHTGDSVPAVVAVYSEDGTPGQQIVLPWGGFYRMSYDGKTLVAACDQRILIFQPGKELRCFTVTPHDEPNGTWIFPFIVGNNELRLAWLDGTIERYELPRD